MLLDAFALTKPFAIDTHLLDGTHCAPILVDMALNYTSLMSGNDRYEDGRDRAHRGRVD